MPKNLPRPLDFIGPSSSCSLRDVWEQWAMNAGYKHDTFCWPLLLSNTSRVNSDLFTGPESVTSFATSGHSVGARPAFFRGTLSSLGVTLTEQTDGGRWTKWNYSDRFHLSRRRPGTEMIKVRRLQKWWILNVCRPRGCSWRCLSFVHAVNWILHLFWPVLFYRSAPGWHRALFRLQATALGYMQEVTAAP